MGIADTIGTYIILSPLLLLIGIGQWKLFEKAGEAGWKGFIPIYSTYTLMKLSGRPGWWVIWLFLPLVNIVVTIGVYIDFIKSYGKYTLRDKIAGLLLPYIFLPKWGFDSNITYWGPSATTTFKQSHPETKKIAPLEWAGGLLTVVLPAIFIRAFFFEAYTTPTPSMERTLLVGDAFFVSKLDYGARLPMTPIAYPFAHHRLPIIGKAYSDALEFGYHRLPGFGTVKKGDIVVFNYPMEADSPFFRPVDKRETYMKRCEGTPGDTVSLVDGQVYVNGKAVTTPATAQTDYVITNSGDINPQIFQDLHISNYEGSQYLTMTKASAAALRKISAVKSVKPAFEAKGIPDQSIFPNGVHIAGDRNFNWNTDNYGPVIIPKHGWTIKLDSLTLPVYRRAINVYEGNKLEQRGTDVYINGVKTDSYTFKMNYYWMMGDNRHDSLDSRYWGFVPEDHVIGKASFIWMSWDENAPIFSKIRWNRIFKGID